MKLLRKSNKSYLTITGIWNRSVWFKLWHLVRRWRHLRAENIRISPNLSNPLRFLKFISKLGKQLLTGIDWGKCHPSSINSWQKVKHTLYIIRGHSKTTWTKFYPILTPTPLEWTKLDILHTIYPLSHNPQGLLNAPLQACNKRGGRGGTCPPTFWRIS